MAERARSSQPIPAAVGNALVFLPWDSIEPEAQRQIMNTAEMPFVFRHVAVMPDCHYGKGPTVGTVLPTRGAVIPAAVGVDIGCGMIAVRTPLRKPDIPGAGAIRDGIERRIPMSAGRNNRKMIESARPRVAMLEQQALAEGSRPDRFDSEWRLALGTLGGGNHFIELAEDLDGQVWVTRKGGIEARRGMWAMIPGSMGARSYIVEGRSNADSFCSAPHGAGRRYSRTKARQLFTMRDLDEAMRGIEFRRSQVLLDEIPGAYKDIDQVMEYARDLVDVRYVLKQFVNVKGE